MLIWQHQVACGCAGLGGSSFSIGMLLIAPRGGESKWVAVIGIQVHVTFTAPMWNVNGFLVIIWDA